MNIKNIKHSLYMEIEHGGDLTSKVNVHWQKVYELIKATKGKEYAQPIVDHYELFAEINSLLLQIHSELVIKEIKKKTSFIY